MNGADWLLAALAAEGVPVLFGNPGSTELPLTDALGRQDRVRYVLALHESVAMGMADGYAQATGRIAVVNVHVQPGLANAMSGILNAARSRVPLVVTVGQQVQELLPGEPFLGGELVRLAEPLAKGAWEVARAEDLPATFARAVRTASAHPRGPVVLSLPLDVQVAAAPGPHVPRPPAAPPAPPARGARPGGRPPRRGPRARDPRRRRGGARRRVAPTSPGWPSASARRSSASRWGRRSRCRPITASGAVPCRPSRRRSPRCSPPTTSCSPSGCRCSASSGGAPVRRSRRRPG